MARDAEDRAVVYCPGQSVGERLQRIVQQPNEGGVRGPGNFRFTAGGKSFGSGVQAVLESGAVAQRDRIPDAGGIRRRTWAGLRYAPSAPSAVTTPTDSHKLWYIKWGQANSGAHVYMGSSPVGSNYLVVANTSNNTIIQKIGPVVGGTGVRPFTINSEETLAFITIDGLLGFNVGDISTGTILYTVHVAGFPACAVAPNYCSHGISLSPDDREIYVVDTPNNYVH